MIQICTDFSKRKTSNFIQEHKSVVCPKCGKTHSYYGLPIWRCEHCKYRFINFNLLSIVNYKMTFYFTGTIPIWGAKRMLQVLENNSLMDHRIKFRCNKCGVIHVVFTYVMKYCPLCKTPFPNVFLMNRDIEYRKKFYFGKVTLWYNY